ncbi:hypothetical protein PAXRUDRAFT_12904 [Paxillus rubicundulus Ve08.2h10]|uniref:Uncharacterized protein n=1 Tax=Paxillus rubicundulus Ve08.2h10 TaxID=930991 RepID=A0A0D0E602_9AGAM|nr:hypothetical protein PAXRUDRAFT_12904 [Paxillus rubicundulus Ve08.2h10]
MSTHNNFPFSRLFVDLALQIMYFAATPDFQSTLNNPYACGLALCSVSKAVRCAALPRMLHTVLLTRTSSITKFVAALRIQKGFTVTNQLLFVDYTIHIRRIWIGHFPDPPPSAPIAPSFFGASPPESSIDFSLLAPVILGAPSLGLDFLSVSLLHDCLDWAWRHHTPAPGEDDMDAGTSSARLTLPWRTSTLALTGCFSRWLPFTSTSEGSAFLASLPSLILLPEFIASEDLEKVQGPANARSRVIPTPVNLGSGIPWASFRGLQRLTVPLASTAASTIFVEATYRDHFFGYIESMAPCDGNIDVVLFTMNAPPGPSRIATEEWVDRAMQAYVQEGKGDLALVDVHMAIDDIWKLIYFNWDVCWARGFSTNKGTVGDSSDN